MRQNFKNVVPEEASEKDAKNIFSKSFTWAVEGPQQATNVDQEVTQQAPNVVQMGPKQEFGSFTWHLLGLSK